MAWRLHLDVHDDGADDGRRSPWRARLAVAGVALLASLWLVAVGALAVWASRLLP